MAEANHDQIRVVVAMDFPDDIIEQLGAISPRLHVERQFPNVPEQVWADTEILYTLTRFPDPAQAPRLRWIQLHFAGVEHALKQPIVQAEDVELTNASGIHAVQMSEYALAMMLAFNYKVPELLQLEAKVEWPVDVNDRFKPHELRGQTLGIVGYGSIGRELARLADHMGMTVLATKRDAMHPAEEGVYVEFGTGDPNGDIPARIYPSEALISMVTECDFVVITAPLTESSRHMVDEKVLKAMKKTAVLVNVSRGALIDEAALISALAAKVIGGAALDVFEEEPLPATSPLWNLDNVIITPHISGNSTSYYEKAAALFAENLERYVQNRPLLNRVDRKRGY